MDYQTIKSIMQKNKSKASFFNIENKRSVSGAYDFSILGTSMRRILLDDLRDATKKISSSLNIYAHEVNTAILTKKETVSKSGHLSNFYDEYYVTPEGKFRKDKHDVNPVTKKPFSPDTKVQKIMGMFSFKDNKKREIFLRPETCQQIFIGLPIYFEELKTIKNLTNQEYNLEKFALYQVGKAFRQEIVNNGNVLTRRQEFEIFEIENFSFKPWDNETHEEIINKWEQWLIDTYNINEKNLRIREHDKNELSFYSSRTVDIEYKMPNGNWEEIFGIAQRGNYDCVQQGVFIGRDRGEYTAPYVLEVSAGIERLMVMIEHEIKR